MSLGKHVSCAHPALVWVAYARVCVCVSLSNSSRQCSLVQLIITIHTYILLLPKKSTFRGIGSEQTLQCPVSHPLQKKDIVSTTKAPEKCRCTRTHKPAKRQTAVLLLPSHKKGKHRTPVPSSRNAKGSMYWKRWWGEERRVCSVPGCCVKETREKQNRIR